MLDSIATALVLAPHPDDEILGCGGTMARLVAMGRAVHVGIVTSGQPPRFAAQGVAQVRAEAVAAHAAIGVTATHWLDLPAAALDTLAHAELNAAIGQLVREVAPDTLFVPFVGDIHRDHQLVFEAALVAARPRGPGSPRRVYAYETLSETNWNAPYLTPAFLPNMFVDISATLDVKLAAFGLFASQVQPAPSVSGRRRGLCSRPRGRLMTLRILVTSAGRRVELVNCFRAAAAGLGIDAEMLACDLKPALSAACHGADRAFAVPRADDAGYAGAILEICRREGVALVVPTIDPELLPLSLAAAEFAALGCTLAASAPALIEIARDKLATALFLEAHGIPSPRTAVAEAAIADPAAWDWPLFVKPRHGSAGRGVGPVAAPGDIDISGEPMVVQALLRGAEFTVNIYCDRSGALRCAVPHERLQVRAGEVEKGITRAAADLRTLARRIAAVLPGPYGALCFQAVVDAAGAASVFEINARFGGGYPLADRAGAHFARWLIEAARGLPSTANDDWQAGLMMLRYDAAVFVMPGAAS
jgi:carbamoyl-phosphate synthase large subunit